MILFKFVFMIFYVDASFTPSRSTASLAFLCKKFIISCSFPFLQIQYRLFVGFVIYFLFFGCEKRFQESYLVSFSLKKSKGAENSMGEI